MHLCIPHIYSNSEKLDIELYKAQVIKNNDKARNARSSLIKDLFLHIKLRFYSVGDKEAPKRTWGFDLDSAIVLTEK